MIAKFPIHSQSIIEEKQQTLEKTGEFQIRKKSLKGQGVAKKMFDLIKIEPNGKEIDKEKINMILKQQKQKIS